MLDDSSELGLADLGWASPGSIEPGTTIVQHITVDATLDGAPLEDILSLKCSSGWDQPVSEAQITLRSRPAGYPGYHLPVTVTVNEVLRFTGIVCDWDFSAWPTSVTLLARGELAKADEFSNSASEDALDPILGVPGLSLYDLLGSWSGTLKQIVSAVLTACGVSYDASNFADPAHVYGLAAIGDEFVWRWGESGLSFLHRLFEASAGYRLFHSGDGKLYLAQIVGRPRNTPDLSLIYGTDILDGARAGRSIAKQRNGVSVVGYDDGAGLGPLRVTVIEGTDYPPDRVETISSALIEDETFAGELANDYWLPELNREFVQASVSTWRDDVMGPAQTHLVDMTDESGVGEPLWVISQSLEVTDRGEFSQSLTYVGGGAGDYPAVPI